ncbi:hypothetical protein KR51_00003660 [Rubidibacter lacunae KORDI 51-2]|uniref:Uncharacterized protein n=1 Tax=Rubidibacter lacunae KORDI 51-2 TaxID=582515 RepID=U5DTP9_9CHRO|nr:hypothetical protein [Rubidibacter lacunae]ERN43050.1 hypothetical protein KR51_00003660 [Rubidibacter lacunae KORDI 51-2]
MSVTDRILSELPGNVASGLAAADRLWQTVRNGDAPVTEVVKTVSQPLNKLDCDLAICGGTLGIFIGAALQQRGWRVTLIERSILRGRDQEWNISRQELTSFLELNLLTEAELEQAIVTEYNPARVGFLGSPDVWVDNVLNIGIDPVFLLDRLKAQFLAAGGRLIERATFTNATVHPNGVLITAECGETLEVRSRLLVDAMGNFSPIARQARNGAPPDSACVVVGSCATGYPNNKTGDLLASFTSVEHQCQYFWEAFPARDGRTTYLFTYLDADRDRPSLRFFLDEYFRLLPHYQTVDLDRLNFKRVLFGFFPSYRQSPLRVPWARVLPIGDSAGLQSPVSFGGFGSLVRHLPRLTHGIDDALRTDALDCRDLALLQPYQPNIAVTWLFQRAMSIGLHQTIPEERTNNLLGAVFTVMERGGDRVLRPFLQDVVQFSALTQTLVLTAIAKPYVVLPVIPHVGIPALLDWSRHYAALALYTGLHALGPAIAPLARNLSPIAQYRVRRWLDAWKYGSGADYGRHAE